MNQMSWCCTNAANGLFKTCEGHCKLANLNLFLWVRAPYDGWSRVISPPPYSVKEELTEDGWIPRLQTILSDLCGLFFGLCFGCRYGKPVVSCRRSLREMASGLQAARQLYFQARSRFSLLRINLDLCYGRRSSSSLRMEQVSINTKWLLSAGLSPQTQCSGVILPLVNSTNSLCVFRYIPEGFQCSCGPDWYTTGNKYNNESFVMFIFGFGFAIPFFTIVFCYAQLLVVLKSVSDAPSLGFCVTFKWNVQF